MPPTPADPNNQPPPQQAGPFDAYLNPVQPLQQYQSSGPKQTSGFEGTGGKVAQIADKFLEGLSHGRTVAFQRSEQENSQRLGLIRQKMSEVEQADLPDATKKQLLQQLNQTFGQMVYHQIPDDAGAGKGKKGGGPTPQGGGDGQQQQPDAATHIRTALKNIVGGLIGPGGQKENISKEDLGKMMTGVDTVLRDPNQSLTAQMGQSGQALHQTLDAYVKGHGGHTPTTGELLQDPAFFKAYQANFGLTGKPTPEMQAILAVTDAEAAKRAKIEEEAAKQKEISQRTKEQDERAIKVAQIQAGGRQSDVQLQQDAATRREQLRINAMSSLRKAQIDRAEAAARLDNIKSNLARHAASGRTGTGGKPEDAASIADAIEKGQQPPSTTGLYKLTGAVRAKLSQDGYDMVGAQRDWQAVQRHMATLNGPQQTRIIESTAALKDMLPAIRSAYDEWLQTDLPTGFKSYNKLALKAAAQGNGESSRIAQNLLTYINDAVSESGQIYMGGNSPTDKALDLASHNLQADWNEQTFKSSLDILNKNITIRQNSILNAPVVGVRSDSPYLPPGSGGTAAPANSPAPRTPPPTSQAGRPPAAASSALPRPAQPGAPIGKPQMMQYLQAAGGDPEKAKALAAKDQWGPPQ